MAPFGFAELRQMKEKTMNYAVSPPPQAHLDITGSDEKFPVRRIYCIGKNYTAHVIEMGGVVEREPPVIFQKPADSVVRNGGDIHYPAYTKNYHYEGEMVVVLKSGGHNIATKDAPSHIFGYAVGLDMTRRDHQAGALENGLPWEMAKAFDQSAPIGPVTKIEETGEITNGNLNLSVNGDVKQDVDMSLMIWKTDEIISKLSEQYELKAGDVIMTGTPAGVGAVVTGDRINVHVDGLQDLQVWITETAG
jgi:fumarylpyruvate hydrolase